MKLVANKVNNKIFLCLTETSNFILVFQIHSFICSSLSVQLLNSVNVDCELLTSLQQSHVRTLLKLPQLGIMQMISLLSQILQSFCELRREPAISFQDPYKFCSKIVQILAARNSVIDLLFLFAT